MKGFFKMKSETRKQSDKNGSLLLEELVASSDGKYNPIRMFSSDQILKETNNFDADHIIAKDRFIWYKGTIEERRVLVKKWEGDHVLSPDNVYRDISILSMMSSHKNVLKLLGCCVEFHNPVMVCEYAEKGPLQVVDKEGFPLPWSTGLKIGKEIASAITYLHTAFPRVIINREINPRNIFLDENGTAKLSSFCLCISIPKGESCVFDEEAEVYGISVDPDYYGTGLVSEKFDVYSFGVTMLFLLAGELGVQWLAAMIGEFGFPFPVSVGKLSEHFIDLIDQTIWNSDIKGLDVQVKAFFGLSLRCVRFWPGKDFLTMIDVARELKLIEGIVTASSKCLSFIE
ncbi:unnamed protein product [Arabidopsis halleri]